MATLLANISIKDASAWNTYLNLIYPIGSIYLAYNATSPASRFGGSWTAITGRFIYANNGTAVGGSNNHNHTLGGYGYALIGTNGNKIRYNYPNSSGITWYPNYYVSTNDYGHTDSGSTSDPTNLTGGTSTSSNMPAYQTVYCWRRTA